MASISRDKTKLVRALYYGERLNAVEIGKRLGVTKDAVYYFMKRNGLHRRTFVDQNFVRFDKKKPSFKPKEKLTFKERELRIAGIMLYWAEGFKSRKADIVDFANSDPNMILVFLKFLREICGVNEAKLRIYLYCYSNQDVQILIRFWSKTTSIPEEQFTKPYVRKDFDVKKIGKMRYGLIHIRYSDKKLLQLLLGWIQGYINNMRRW